MSIQAQLQKIDKEELASRVTSLDQNIVDFLSNDGTITILEQLQVKYAFPLLTQKENDLGILLTLYITKLISSQDFVNELALLVSPKYFKAFMQELEQKLWSPYDKFLLDAGLVYKQLTVLDPQPIEQEATIQAVSTTPGAQTISAPITPATQQTTIKEQPQPKPFIDTFFAPKPTEPQPIEIKTTPAGAIPQPVAKPIIPPAQQAQTPSGEARIRFAPGRTTIAHAPEPVAQKPATQEPQLTQIRFTSAPAQEQQVKQNKSFLIPAPLSNKTTQGFIYEPIPASKTVQGSASLQNLAKDSAAAVKPMGSFAPQPPTITPATQQPTQALTQTAEQKPTQQPSPTIIPLQTISPRTDRPSSGSESLTGLTSILEQKPIKKTVTNAQPAQPTSELRKAVIDLSTFGIIDSKT